MLFKRYKSTEVRDSLVHQQWHLPSSWNTKRDFYWDVYTILNMQRSFEGF